MPVDISPARAMEYIATYYPKTTSIIYAGGDLTAAEVDDRNARWATWLHDHGVAMGDRVAYLGMNSPTLLLLMLATARLRAVFIPMNFRLASSELEYILDQSGTRTLIVEASYLEMARTFAGAVPVQRYIVIDDDPADPLTGEVPAGWTRTSQLYAEATEHAEALPCYDEHLAALLYTSGTTGRAKGVMLTHGNIWWNHVNVDSVVTTQRKDVTLASAPLFHIGGLNALVLRTLLRGGTVIVRRHFDPEVSLRDMVEHRVTTLFGVPAMYAAVTRLPNYAESDISSVTSAIVAGAPVPPPLIENYLNRGLMLQQAWGLTETAPFATYLPAEHTLDKLGSAGVPMPHTEVKVFDLDGVTEITAPGAPGELCVRGPNVTQGYWRNPEATADSIDRDGWFHTGDIGYRDEDGYLYIVDRLKDMIITGGENVYPAEVEHALISMPKVSEVAVVGVPHEKWGETVVAVVVPTDPQDEPTLEELREFATHHLARYKLPTTLVVTDHLPQNGSGKLDKVGIRNIARKETP